MSYTIQKGDTLWAIVKKEYGLTNNTDIANKVNEVAKENSIFKLNNIKAGQTLNLASNQNVSKPITSQAPVTAQATAPDTATKTEPATTQPTANDNMGKKFDNYTMTYSQKDQDLWDKATTDVVAHNAGHNEISAEVNKQVTAFPKFDFAGPEYEKALKAKDYQKARTVYTTGVMKLSKDAIANEDTDKDGKVSFEEYKKEELAGAKKMGVDDSTELQEVMQRSFKAIDINGDGKIDSTEQASVYAAMDENAQGEMNGKIAYNNYKGISAGLGDPDNSDAISKKIKSAHKFLFENK